MQQVERKVYEDMNGLAQQMREIVDDLVAIAGDSRKGEETKQDGSNTQQMSDAKVTHRGKQTDEIAFLKMILDGLVQNRSLFEPDDVHLNRAFLEDLRGSVDSVLRGDSRIRKDIRIKVLNAFEVLIENYAEYFEA